MRILLDECVPGVMGEALRPHDAMTIKVAGWKGLRNGELLARAQTEFDASFTVDKGIVYQHPAGRFDLRIVCARSITNRAVDVLPYAGAVLDALSTMKRGEVRIIERMRRDKD